jgi:hypothetical protein
MALPARNRLAAVSCLEDHLHVGFASQERHHAGTNHRVVVGHQHPQPSAGVPFACLA